MSDAGANDLDADALAEFFAQSQGTMIGICLKEGASHPEAEEAASVAVVAIQRSWSHFAKVKNKQQAKAFLRTTVVRELWRIWEQYRKQRGREECWCRRTLPRQARDIAAEFGDQLSELDVVRELLTCMKPQQREVVARLYRGQGVREIAEEMGIAPYTVHRYRRKARTDVAPLLSGEAKELRRWRSVGERVREDFEEGLSSPVALRPPISDGWQIMQDLRGDDAPLGHETRVVCIHDDELQQRRAESAVPTGSPILAELVDLARRNGLLAVVLDAGCHVLHRGGDDEALAAANKIDFVDGSTWSLPLVGVTAAGLAQLKRTPISVRLWEHSAQDQGHLSCFALPICAPDGEDNIILNLTATTGTLAGVPHAVKPRLHTIARRLHRQLWTSASDAGHGPAEAT